MNRRIVRLKPEYAEPGDDDALYEVVEDNGDRVAIRPVRWPWPIVPIEGVAATMVEEVPEPSEGRAGAGRNGHSVNDTRGS